MSLKVVDNWWNKEEEKDYLKEDLFDIQADDLDFSGHFIDGLFMGPIYDSKQGCFYVDEHHSYKQLFGSPVVFQGDIMSQKEQEYINDKAIHEQDNEKIDKIMRS